MHVYIPIYTYMCHYNNTDIHEKAYGRGCFGSPVGFTGTFRLWYGMSCTGLRGVQAWLQCYYNSCP